MKKRHPKSEAATDAAPATPPVDVPLPAVQAWSPLPESFEQIELGRLVPSKFNPRKAFDPERMKELASSIASKGIVEPLVVRPVAGNGHFEIVAGERRFRAASLLSLARVPCVIRDYSDADVLELTLVENIQRDDLRPLERARGFRALIDSNPDKHSAMSIASRLGMSVDWVWGQLKLLDLIPAVQTLLEEDRIAVGHAVVIARLKPTDQERVIAVDDRRSHARDVGGLWEDDAAGLPWDEEDPANKDRKPGKFDGLKPRSIRELEHWIADHIRFDIKHAAVAQPLEFETVAARVDEALAKPGRGRKMVAITFDAFTQPEARDESERTYGPKSWKRADGTEKTTRTGWPSNRLVDSPRCEFSVLGVVAAGPHRGEAFDVCIAREKCEVHWKAEMKQKAAGQKSRSSGSEQAKRHERQVAREQRQRALTDARWKLFEPALRKAVTAALAKTSTKLPAPLYTLLLGQLGLPKSTKPANLAHALLKEKVLDLFDGHAWYGAEAEMLRWAKAFKVNVKACEPSKADVEKKAGAAAGGDDEGGDE